MTLALPPADLVRLHCRGCGDPLTRALREVEEPSPPVFRRGKRLQPAELAWARMATPRPGSLWRSRDLWRTDQGVCRFGCVDFGSAGEVLLFHHRDLGGSALPLELRPGCTGCCGPAPSAEGPNLRCHGCRRWAIAEVYGCELPRFGVAWTRDVEVRRALPDVPPPVPVASLDGAHRLHCRRCDGTLSAPLREVVAPRPPLDPPAPGGGAEARPRRGTFWRSRREWTGAEGSCRIGGVDFGRRAEVVMLAYEDLGIDVLRLAWRYPKSGHEGLNLTCNRCCTAVLTEVYQPGDSCFVAGHLDDVELRRCARGEDGDAAG